MAILVEGISVIARRKTIEEKYPEGWAGFVRDVPNNTLCADEEIAEEETDMGADTVASRFLAETTS
jgi:hypothetical protein